MEWNRPSWSDYGNRFTIDESPPTRAPDEALVLHQRACNNLKHVFQKVRGMDAPTIETIYSGTASAPCAPSHLQLVMLFKHFNEIANAHFVAHPSLSLDVNSIIILYGMDIGHCLQWSINMARYNLILMVLVWAGHALGKESWIQQFGPSRKLWESYIYAWLEMVRLDDNFGERLNFIKIWSESPYDLTWFSHFALKKMFNELKKFETDLPPHHEDPADLIDQCREGVITMAQFNEKGPAMALHYLLAKEMTSREEKREREELEREVRESAIELRAANLAWLRAERSAQLASQHTARMTARRQAILAGEDVSSSESDDSDFEITPESDDEEEDEMEVDEEYPVPAGVSLTHLDWDGELLQALLNIDTSIPSRTRFRGSTRGRPWHTSKMGFRWRMLSGSWRSWRCSWR
jgi:hypothetical protein